MSYLEGRIKPGVLSVEGKFITAMMKQRRKEPADVMGVVFCVKHKRNINRWFRQIMLIVDDEEDGFRKRYLGVDAFSAEV